MSDLKYKLVSYKLWDGEILTEEKGNCKDYFLNKLRKNYANYRHELYEKQGRRWVLIESR